MIESILRPVFSTGYCGPVQRRSGMFRQPELTREGLVFIYD